MHKAFKACTAVLLALVMTVSLVSGALAVAVRNDDDTISYEPLEQGVYSKGGYTIDKVSHPTLGAGEVDGILTGDLQDRGQSYSWSMAEAGDYVYIGTCYNSTYYIYHNNVKTSLDAMKKEGKLDQNVDTSRAAADFVKVMFGTDTFDETPMSQWTPVIMAVNRYTGEAQVIFRERDILKDYPDIFPGYPPYLKGVNYLAGYRMAFEFKGKIYFAGMGSPTATLIEVDPETNECSIAYHNINYTQGVSNGVHGLLVFDDEIYMCLATDNYDGNGTPGGIIVASSDPTAGLSSWRRVADQDDFDGLPAVMKTDGKQDILLASANGMVICFNENDVRVMGRDAAGVRGMMLDAGDYVVGAGIAAKAKQLLSVTECGYGKRTEIESYLRLGEDGQRRPQNRGGKGLKGYNITAKTGKIAGVAIVDDADDIMLIENGGVLIRMAAADINVYGRDTQGVILMRLESGSRVISVDRVDREPEEPAENEEA